MVKGRNPLLQSMDWQQILPEPFLPMPNKEAGSMGVEAKAKPYTEMIFSRESFLAILKGDELITGEDVIPGFSCRVAEFFED
jgi:hypothetical protein